MSFYGEDSPTDATESRRKYLQSWRDKLGPYKFEARNDLRATDGARRAAPARDARTRATTGARKRGNRWTFSRRRVDGDGETKRTTTNARLTTVS
jgi:hypothetical protein